MSAETPAIPARHALPPATPAALPLTAILLWTGALLASAAPWFGQLDPGAVFAAFWTFNEDNYLSVLAHFSWAPRVSIAILIGCGLGLAGAVTQQILGNPLASPTTLGAVNMAFLLLRGEWLGNLFIWGAGSLVQNNWQAVMELWPRVLVLAVLMLLLTRPLQVLQLGQASASSLGAKVGLIRVLALLLVVLMSATVVSRVGVVAFIGLAAPVLARLLGARTLGSRLLWSTLLGAGLLLLADTLAHWASTWGDGSLVPTGTTTALIGGPIILLALQGFKNIHHMPGQESSPAGFLPARRPVALVSGVLVSLLLVTTVVSMGWSPGLEGWNWTVPGQWNDAWLWRGPRMLAAILAGVALGLAGTLIQRMTGNAMASPEMLGISGGAAVVMVLIVLSGADIGRAGQLGGATPGAAAALGLLIMLARRHNFAGNQLLLGGLALYVFMDAGLRLVMASGGTVASQLLNWMYGSTWLVSEPEALGLMALILGISATLLLIVRPLTILPLGETTASSLGLPVGKARLLLLVLAALLTASATVVIGPLSFVGLIAPHLARVMGQQTVGRQLIVAALAGGLLLGVADYISRVVIYPEQPALLTDQVKADYPQASESRAIRARVSVLQQDLALNIIAPLTLRLFRDGKTTLPDPDCIGLMPVTQDRAGPAARWFQMANGTSVDEDRFIRSLGSLASDWYPVFRKALGVSPGAYWSSIGLGLGAPFSAVWNLAAPVSVCNLAQRWLREFNNDADQFIDWIPVVFDGQTTAIPQRKGCCLKYLLPEGGYCGTCGVYRKERLAALRQQKPGPATDQWQPGQ